MKISENTGDGQILVELGRRVTQARLNQNLTQAQLAEQAGISKRTVERLESGAVATQLSGFIRACRVLGLLERLGDLIPEAVPSPIAQLKLQGQTRQRAARTKHKGHRPKQWSWGDEA